MTRVFNAVRRDVPFDDRLLDPFDPALRLRVNLAPAAVFRLPFLHSPMDAAAVTGAGWRLGVGIKNTRRLN